MLCFLFYFGESYSGSWCFFSSTQNSMATLFIFVLLLNSLLSSGYAQIESKEEAFTSLVISEKGLEFLKDFLMNKAISSVIPLQLFNIEKSKKIPVVGNVHMMVSDITIHGIDVPSSNVKLGDEGITVIASNTTCSLSMNWYYSYRTWLAPIEISDKGHASVQVEGMDVGLTLALKNEQGSLRVLLKDHSCHVNDISIDLDGGASWLYQGMIDAFEGPIGSAVEKAVMRNLEEGISRLDSYIQDLPKAIPVDDHASVNVTVIDDPVLGDSNIRFDINGLLTTRQKLLDHNYRNKSPKYPNLCSDPSKMIGIVLDEAVFNSASAFYYNAEFVQWIVDKVHDQSILNTAGWRFIIPQLYKKYPNCNMNLNITLSSPPVVNITDHKAAVIIYADLVIDVLDASDIIPVACISLEIHGSGSVQVNGNNLTGSIKLEDFAMALKWSNIGNLQMYLIEPVVWTLIHTVFVPYANVRLSKGYPLPIIRRFTLQNAEIILLDSKITVCSNVAHMGTPESLHSVWKEIAAFSFL